MTDAELQGLCAQAFNLAKLDLERNRFVWLLAAYDAGHPLHRMKKIEALVTEKLGEGWLDSGVKKDAAFDMIRLCVRLAPPDAVVFASAVNLFEHTEKFAALDSEAQRTIMSAGHDRHHEAVREGLLAVCDALVTLAQTPQRICNQIQKLGPRGTPVDQPKVQFWDARDFQGRLKLFGAPSFDFTKKRM